VASTTKTATAAALATTTTATTTTAAALAATATTTTAAALATTTTMEATTATATSFWTSRFSTRGVEEEREEKVTIRKEEKLVEDIAWNIYCSWSDYYSDRGLFLHNIREDINIWQMGNQRQDRIRVR